MPRSPNVRHGHVKRRTDWIGRHVPKKIRHTGFIRHVKGETFVDFLLTIFASMMLVVLHNKQRVVVPPLELLEGHNWSVAPYALNRRGGAIWHGAREAVHHEVFGCGAVIFVAGTHDLEDCLRHIALFRRLLLVDAEKPGDFFSINGPTLVGIKFVENVADLELDARLVVQPPLLEVFEGYLAIPRLGHGQHQGRDLSTVLASKHPQELSKLLSVYVAALVLIDAVERLLKVANRLRH
mmetsp:Transcript_144185/g.401728  ORF Transcript_144185/g.401728 Transcript_144185/m.401728 type:complete len:238 (+) Transcript_144185:709-1422(+)